MQLQIKVLKPLARAGCKAYQVGPGVSTAVNIGIIENIESIECIGNIDGIGYTFKALEILKMLEILEVLKALEILKIWKPLAHHKGWKAQVRAGGSAAVALEAES